MKRVANIAFVLVYLVVLAGSIVRMTGSGMGCPDWPKCFGLLIPPTSEDQIKWSGGVEYSEGVMVIERDTLWVSIEDHLSFGEEFESTYWEPYAKHNYARFNVVHTWIEYLNRLTGALSGIPVIILFFLSIRSRRRIPIILASATVASVLFVSWLGKLVVEGNLIPFSITVHMVSALAILVLLVGLIQHLEGTKTLIRKATRNWIFISLLIAFMQLVFGTQVREAVDLALESNISRANLIDSLPGWWVLHRSAVWAIIAIHLMWAIPMLKNENFRNYAQITIAILLGQTLTGLLFTQMGFPAFAQPIHIILGFALVLIDFRTLIASKI
ncbi:MAG: heme A synthase [Flavobacteriales bacterium]|nr:heme A synthase [Flavobacteriales bacterium]MBT6174477.1 heme A synthase [Flavobacteriales bacterium]